MPHHPTPSRAPNAPQQMHIEKMRAGLIASAKDRMRAVLFIFTLRRAKRDQSKVIKSSKLRSLENFDSSGADQKVLLNPQSNDALRMRLSRRGGGERLEFLLSCWNFEGAANSLQRFAQMSHIVDRFVRAHAERPIELSERSRRLLLQEWSRWSDEGRIPQGIRMSGLEAAAEEIHLQVAEDPLTPFLLSEPAR